MDLKGEGAADGEAGWRRAPGWPRCAVKLTVHPPLLVSSFKEALPPHPQMLRNSVTAAVTRAMLVVILAGHSASGSRTTAAPNQTGAPASLKKCIQAV